jgi:hypothetical protein
VIDLTDEEDDAVFEEHFLEGHLAVTVVTPLRAGHCHRHHDGPAAGDDLRLGVLERHGGGSAGQIAGTDKVGGAGGEARVDVLQVQILHAFPLGFVNEILRCRIVRAPGYSVNRRARVGRVRITVVQEASKQGRPTG